MKQEIKLKPLKVIDRRHRVTGEERRQLMTTLAEHYAAGVSMHSLAERTGRSFGAIQRLLGEAAGQGLITIRPRGGRRQDSH